jgi:hypothetical protein
MEPCSDVTLQQQAGCIAGDSAGIDPLRSKKASKEPIYFNQMLNLSRTFLGWVWPAFC